MKYFIAIGAILLAVVFYSYFVYKRQHLKCLGKLNFLKLLYNLIMVLIFADGLTVLTQKLFTALYVHEDESEARLRKSDVPGN